MEPRIPRLEDAADRSSRRKAERCFPHIAAALRRRTPSILVRWRIRSVASMPDLDRLTITEFDNSIAAIIESLAQAMENGDPSSVRRLVEQSPAHGLTRFAQKYSSHDVFGEHRIFRSVIVLELQEELGRPLTHDEAAPLHELLDIIAEYSSLALMDKRGEARDNDLREQVSGMHRLADLGTLVAGVAHDAINLLLPLRMGLDHLQRYDLPEGARAELDAVQLIVRQFENSIVNLQWLSVDPAHGPIPTAPLNLERWAIEIGAFQRRMLPTSTSLTFDLPPWLPNVQISSAALSQAVFNLVRNAQQAIATEARPGRIALTARARDDGAVELVVEDDGPGMSPEVLRRCAEPFFTTRRNGSGLGLALVVALITGCGGRVEFQSPVPGTTHGTRVVLVLPPGRNTRR